MESKLCCVLDPAVRCRSCERDWCKVHWLENAVSGPNNGLVDHTVPGGGQWICPHTGKKLARTDNYPIVLDEQH